MPSTGLRINGGEADVAYGIHGSGPALVLVHGTGTRGEAWDEQVQELQGKFTVVTPDLSGSGGTVDHGGPLTLDDLVAEVLAVADHAGLDTFHIAGHSLGAVVALRLAADHPERVRSVVSHAGWAYTDERMTADFRYCLDLLRTDAELGTSLVPQMFPLATLGPRYWAATDRASHEKLVQQIAENGQPGTARQFEVGLTVDLRPLLGRITAPVLVFASTHDRVCGANQQQLLREGIAGASYAEIDTGHNALAEDPQGFAEVLGSFLTQHAGA
ncbi:alpha/beta fold hydrolase [Streptomyces sp. NBC_00083]|uniref:alpha/beta fold hydrolase n=1 Tax=Streptomyces sp. NBC_00083 TaxID=2975647 RepID=UPI002255704A|nr:alpha/beta hydrolase [Streptomyces sp. NBC_00083]MCX5388023.1 alpha/beta hydrolase [Streptomyces sp. NBC_00083]